MICCRVNALRPTCKHRQSFIGDKHNQPTIFLTTLLTQHSFRRIASLFGCSTMTLTTLFVNKQM